MLGALKSSLGNETTVLICGLAITRIKLSYGKAGARHQVQCASGLHFRWMRVT